MQIVTVLGVVMLLVSAVLGGIALIQKLCGQALGGLYHRDSDSALFQQRDDDQFGHHWILHRENV